MRDELSLSNALLDIFPGFALVIKKHSREIVFCNAVARRMGAVAGKTCFETICKSDTSCPFCKAPDLWGSGERQRVESEYLGRFWEGVWFPYNDDFYLHYMLDITDRKRTEEKLRRSEATARTLLDLPNAAGFLLDRNGICLDCNETVARRFSRRRSEIIGKKIWDIFPKEVAERRKAHFEQLLSDKKQVNLVDERDGMWNESIVTPMLDDNGEVEAVSVFGFDITELKKIEQKLVESEERLRNINNNLTNGMIYQLLRLTDGSRKFTYLSDAVHRFYGVTPDDAMSDPSLIYNRVHEEDRMRVWLEEEEANRTLSVFKAELRMLGPSGEIRWSSFVSSPHVLPDGATCWDGIEFDITELKRAEEQLKEGRDTFEKYLNVANEIIVALDTSGNITLMNDSGHRLLCYDVGELIGRNWFDTCLPEESRVEVRGVFGRLMSGETDNVAIYENKLIDKHGTELNILWHNTLLKGVDGRIVGSLSSGENITGRKNIELELEKHRSELELLVSERTAELQQVNKKLNNEIIERKQAEKALEETNSALRVLLKQRESDRVEFEEKVISNIKLLLMPHLEKARKTSSKHGIGVHLNILESNIKELTSSFALKLSSTQVGLTPKEIAVAGMVRDGYQDKDIAESLKLSTYTVKVHRKNIRRKLGIKGKNINLSSFLSSINE